MPEHMAVGGEAYHPPGFIVSGVPGRTDRLPMSVQSNSHVIPADVVSGLGQGNSLAGAQLLEQALQLGPYGVKMPQANAMARHAEYRGTLPHASMPRATENYARGGAPHRTPIMAAGGEYIVGPEDVARLGGGDPSKGHAVLDKFILAIRKHTASRLRKLPPPKK